MVLIVGVPKEIKPDENRVALTPAGVNAFCVSGSSGGCGDRRRVRGAA